MELALLTITAGGVVGNLIQAWLTYDEIRSFRQFATNKIEELESEYWERMEAAEWNSPNGGEL